MKPLGCQQTVLAHSSQVSYQFVPGFRIDICSGGFFSESLCTVMLWRGIAQPVISVFSSRPILSLEIARWDGCSGHRHPGRDRRRLIERVEIIGTGFVDFLLSFWTRVGARKLGRKGRYKRCFNPLKYAHYPIITILGLEHIRGFNSYSTSPLDQHG